MTARRRMRRKAVMRVESFVAVSDQMTTVALTRDLRTFLNERMYGSSGLSEDSVSLIVGASERFSRRLITEVECDLRRGVNVRYFLESIATLILPFGSSLTGRWWSRISGI